MNQHDMTRNMVLAALFAALTAMGSFLQIPTGTVPITLQFLFTALAASAMCSSPASAFCWD